VFILIQFVNQYLGKGNKNSPKLISGTSLLFFILFIPIFIPLLDVGSCQQKSRKICGFSFLGFIWDLF